jgi:hypothetical protein
MPAPTSLCGAPNASGGTCRRAVSKAGDRCALHAKRRPKSPNEILTLCMKAVTKVSEFAAVSELFMKLYPHVEPWVEPLRGVLMPEYFWDAFFAKDRRQMGLERRRAYEKLEILEERYRWFSDAQKLAIEDAYVGIIEATAQQAGSSKNRS